MKRAFDAIVVGLGAMGSASLRALARRGSRVLGLDRFAPPHAFGSSHGKSRIIREAYFEHPAYVPFVHRAYLLWEELERESGRRLLLRTGGLMVGEEGGTLVAGALRSAREHGLPCEMLAAPEIRRRFPAFRPEARMVGVWEPRAGVLFPEQCVGADLASARRHGAVIRTGEPALSWRADGEGVTVTTSRGRYRGAWLLLAAGAWVARLLPELSLPLAIERVVQLWFAPAGEGADFEPARCPISIWEHEPDRFFYAFPLLERTVKVARHHEGEAADPDHLRREVDDADVAPVRELVRRFMPGAGGALAASAVCMYTNTPDSHFVLDVHPGHPRVLIVSACSGHGFKFAPAIGEIATDLIVDGSTRFDLSLFRLRRWG